MELPVEIWANIIIHADPADYMRIGMINASCRRILSDEWFVRKWLQRHRPAAWERTILTALMIKMCACTGDTVDALVNVIQPTSPLYRLSRIVTRPGMRRQRLAEGGFTTPWPQPRLELIKRTPSYACDGRFELIVLEGDHAVVARKSAGCGSVPIHMIIYARRARKRGIIFPLDTCGILRQCDYIAALDSDDPHLRDRHIPNPLGWGRFY